MDSIRLCLCDDFLFYVVERVPTIRTLMSTRDKMWLKLSSMQDFVGSVSFRSLTHRVGEKTVVNYYYHETVIFGLWLY